MKIIILIIGMAIVFELLQIANALDDIANAIKKKKYDR